MASFADLMELQVLGPDRFLAPAAPEPVGRMYGGQLLAQALLATQRTVEADRFPHSLHSYFLRAGNTSDPLEVAVERVRDGRAFSSRAAVVHQAGRELFRLQASFQVPEVGLDYAGPPAPPVPAPEAVAMTYNEFQFGGGPVDDSFRGAVRPMDIRYVNPPPFDRTAVEAPQLLWMRIAEDLGQDPALHTAGLAYLADSTLIDHVVLPHGLRWQDDNLDSASLDHTMWFHRPTRVDGWLLYEQFVEATGGARGLARGRFLDRQGVLVATCVQEGLIRVDG